MLLSCIFHNIYTRRGFGIHSPYVFKLVTEVIGGRLPYYAFGPIAGFVSRLKGEQIGVSVKKGRVLFRLVNFFRVEQLLLVGKFAPDIALYMMAPKSELKLYCEASEEEQAIFSETMRERLIINKSINLNKIATFVYWRNSLEVGALEKITDLIRSLAPESVLIVENTKHFVHGKRLFEHLEAMPQISISIKTNDLGIFVFKPNMNKKSYKAYY